MKIADMIAELEKFDGKKDVKIFYDGAVRGEIEAVGLKDGDFIVICEDPIYLKDIESQHQISLITK